MSFRILGASHANTLRSAYDSEHCLHPVDIEFRGLAALKEFYTPFHHFDGQKITFTNPEIASGFDICFAQKAIPEKNQFWGVVAGFTSVRIYADWGWHSGYSVTDAEKPKKFHVSKALIYHLNQHYSAPWFQFLLDLKKMGHQVLLIAVPPPMRVHPSFLHGVDPDVSIHINNLVAEHWREFCQTNEIDSIEVPARLLDKQGFLLQRYVIGDGVDDWTHGNLTYGQEMLVEVFDYFTASKKN